MSEEDKKNVEDWTPSIAEHWKIADFEDVVESISTNGIKIPQKSYLSDGEYPIVDQGQDLIGGYTNDKNKVLLNIENAIVFGDHTRCFKSISFEFAPGADGVKVLKPSNGVDFKFIFYALRNTELPNRGYSRHYSFLKKSKLPLPPLNEQKRIVVKIEKLFSELNKGVESLKYAKEQLKIYRQSILKHAFEGKLTEKWRKQNAATLETAEELLEKIKQEREKYYERKLQNWKQAVKLWKDNGKQGKKPSKLKSLKEFDALSDDIIKSLPSIPNTWLWGKIGNLTTGVEYGTSAKSSELGDVSVIRMGNLQNGSIDWSELVYTSDKKEIEKYLLTPNDVLFNRTNSPELVGKTAKYRGEQPALFAGYLIRVNQIKSIVIADYLNYFLNSYIAKQYGNSVKTDGVNQSNINGEKLQNYPS